MIESQPFTNLRTDRPFKSTVVRFRVARGVQIFQEMKWRIQCKLWIISQKTALNFALNILQNDIAYFSVSLT